MAGDDGRPGRQDRPAPPGLHRRARAGLRRDGRPELTRFSYLRRLECSRCDASYDADVRHGVCPACAAPLLARYELAAIGTRPADLAGRPPDLWRYHELLPVSAAEQVVTLGEGMTPLLQVPRLGAALGVERLLVKDEGPLPTGSFKARGAAVGVSRARELGVRRVAMPTNGNAGAAWAMYAARAGLAITVVMPVDAPVITRAEVVAAGGDLRLVDGLISDAGRLIAVAVADSPADWFEVATLKEPYRIEGKKTMGFEIAEQLGWRMPDVIVCPTGGGVGVIAIHKALIELIQMGWVTGALPRLVAVQASGCAPIVAAFEAGLSSSAAWPEARTVAFGMNVPKALGDFLVLAALAETGGTAIAVDDEQLLADIVLTGSLEGLHLCPEGAATVSAVRELRQRGWISASDEVVLLNTGSGLLYPDAVPVAVPIAAPEGALDLPP